MKKITSALAVTLILAGCGGKAPQQPPAAQVAYVTIKQEPVTISTELPGRTNAYETSDVRPQVNGIVLARLFEEGDAVRAGQALYRIDPSPYEATAANARAALASARAGIANSQALARRYGELVKINAVSRQDYENAVASAQQAQASLAAQQATLRNAQIDLGRTTIRAPISGRIGRSTITTGALVSASQTDALSVIQRLDPIHIDIQQSSAALLKLRQQMLDGQLSRDGADARVRLVLEDGSTYPIEGKLKFADVTVDPSTGSQIIRAVFPNPRGLLLPGMFVRAQLVEGTRANAILVPERAVSRNERGLPTVLVVTGPDKVEQREITAPRTVGDNWLVTAGLKPGDKVVVEGSQNIRPGLPVKPVPFTGKPAPAAGQAQAK